MRQAKGFPPWRSAWTIPKNDQVDDDLLFFCILQQYTQMEKLSKVVGFEWDEGNARKNERHGVSMAEAEQVFFNAPLLVLPDASTARLSRDFLPSARPVKDDGRT